MDDIKFNSKDIKLIEILDKNSRISLNEISKELKISKQACNRKINNLYSKGVIKFIPIIDYFILGYNNLHLYLKLRGIEKKNYISLIKKLETIENIAWISEFFGDLDLGISIFSLSLKDLTETLDKIYKLFGENIIEEQKHFITFQQIQSFCYNEECIRSITKVESNKKIIKLSPIEAKIISEIREKGRFNYVNLAAVIRKKPETIKKHIIHLEENKVIKKFKILINFNKLGYYWNICHLFIKKGEDINEIINDLSKEKRAPFFSLTLGNNIILDFISKDYSELKIYMEELRIKYPRILDYKILNVNKIYKIREP